MQKLWDQIADRLNSSEEQLITKIWLEQCELSWTNKNVICST